MGASVVVATDDLSMRDELGPFFKNRDYVVSFEKIGSRAILKLLEQDVDIFILDLKDDDNSNLDLINIIQKTRPRLPIVALSEDTSIERVRDLVERGVFYCAMKPVQIAEMEKVVEAVERYYQKQNDDTEVLSNH